MIYLDRTHVITSMDAQNEPVLTISDGETLTIRTYDCFKGMLLPEDSGLQDVDFNLLNPATGPVYVKGAEAGDTLKIEIQKIKIDDTAVTEVDPDFGCLAEKLDKGYLKRMAVSSQGIQFNDHLHLKLEPMIGVIGVAPAESAVPTDTPGSHGGNMDCTQIKEGAILYLPVYTEGALLAVGDLHACMGDGETGGCGAEIAGEVTMKISVLKSSQKEYPYVVTDTQLNIIASMPSIEEAWREAVELTHQYLLEETCLSNEEAAMLLSLAGSLTICQTVNPFKTVRMSVPLYCLRSCGWTEK